MNLSNSKSDWLWFTVFWLVKILISYLIMEKRYCIRRWSKQKKLVLKVCFNILQILSLKPSKRFHINILVLIDLGAEIFATNASGEEILRSLNKLKIANPRKYTCVSNIIEKKLAELQYSPWNSLRRGKCLYWTYWK